MVKGVNRQIIEINDTGNRYFERVLLFVSPDKSDMPTERLKKEAKSLLLDLSPDFNGTVGLRERYKQKLKRKKLAIAFTAVTLISALTVFLINFL